MHPTRSLLVLGLFAVFWSSSSTAANLSNGSLSVTIRDGNGAIDAVRFGGSDFYNAGTPVSNYGFQNGTSTVTFSRVTTDGSFQGPVAISSVTPVGSSVRVVGSYTGGGASVGFVRTYSLVPGLDVLEVQIELTNTGGSPVSLRWYDTFDPDQGSDLGRGFDTFNDVFEIEAGVRVGQATDTGGLSVVMGSRSPGSLVASGGPFEIGSGSELNAFFTSPVDGAGLRSDQGTHVGGAASLAPGASTTLVYYQAYGLTAEAARFAFLDASAQCFAIDAIDDLYQVINDGSAHDLLVLANDECSDDEPISIVTQPGDLVPDRGGAAITDGTKVTYVPASGFVGFEEFRYTAEDAGLEGGSGSPTVDRDTARVVVNVIEDLSPSAVDDEATTSQNQSVAIDVLANDAPGNPPNTLSVASPPANGNATVLPDGTIRYLPAFDFFGADAFDYQLTDANGDSSVATVSVGVFFVRGPVPIDVVTSDDGNNLNLAGGPGSGFSVAILSVGAFFDAPAQVDPLTLKLGPRQANIWGSAQVRDIDRDGDDDLLVKFLTEQTGIACGDTHVTLSGRTFESQPISGIDTINTFHCPRVRKRY